jgi:hypothetical protein
MAKKFEDIAEGRGKRLIINMAPRHTKSEFASYLLPSWFLGKFPSKKVIQCSNTAELAVGFGRKVRNLVGSEQYKTVFPNVALRQDSKAAGRWSTNGNGEYFAIGVGGTVTGKGADLLIIDNIGMLSSLYQYGNIAYIGGGFGKGIHNILEAATFGLPVIFGINYQKFNEAKELIQLGGAFSIANNKDFERTMKQLSDKLVLQSASRISKEYVESRVGATDKILSDIKILP